MDQLDALIVGAGFGGVYLLKHLRDRGFKVKLLEMGSDFGGVWYWNRYPGACVDSPVPHYEYSSPELWKDWDWTQRFPSGPELRKYFDYVANKWDLHRDAIFNTKVVSAVWKDESNTWTVRAENGDVYNSRFFLPNTGFAARRYIPDWKGFEAFQGEWLHPSYWSDEDKIKVKGKKVAVIGTGSTGVQLVQNLAPLASEFVLFQRTPNLALPMGQREYDDHSASLLKERQQAVYDGRLSSFSGFNFNFMPIATFEHSAEQRKQTYEDLWKEGDFSFWMAGYHDMLFIDEANTDAYNFWRDKVRARIHDSRMQEKLAPAVKPHAFGCKRISLENGYYEVFNQPSVSLVDVNETPVVEITPNGIKTSEKEWQFDIIVCATGYDAITGGILDLNLVGRSGVTLGEHWNEGVKTLYGLSVNGFPNMFFTYGPQAPTSLCNGPSCAELQGNWIISLLEYMRDHELKAVEASEPEERKWAEGIRTIANMTLLPTTKSWYMGDNIPGKVREPLIYLGGIPNYYKTLEDSAKNGYLGFELH